jgi:2-succinyl-5-enolpyruvyl-6-hydroxy-3-cyclohexene-1-carboxylate synthase
VHADPPTTLLALASGIADRRGGSWAGSWGAAWAHAAVVVEGALGDWLAGLDEPFEGQPFDVLPGVVPERTLLWVGSSMPVRDLDAWFDGSERIRVSASRGANGIDGVTSAAAGAAAVHDGPVVLVTGDVSFVHDLGGLVSARLLGVPLTIVVIDNDGGGIFSFLAQATTARPDVGLPDRFEQLFGTPHGTRITDVAAALGATVRDVDHRALKEALRVAIADRSPGVRVLRYATDRRRNVELHRQAADVAAGALGRLA